MDTAHAYNYVGLRYGWCMSHEARPGAINCHLAAREHYMVAALGSELHFMTFQPKRREIRREISSRRLAVAAQFPVSPPENFDFAQPQGWQRWIRWFERFRIATGLNDKSDEVQINMLIYSMGDEADDILKSFKLSADDAKKYSVVKSKFDDHFVKKKET